MRPSGDSAGENNEDYDNNSVKVMMKRYTQLNTDFVDFVFNFEDEKTEVFEDLIDDEHLIYSNQLWKIIDTFHFFLCTQKIITTNDYVIIMLQITVRSNDPREPDFLKWIDFIIDINELVNCGYELDGDEEVDDDDSSLKRHNLQRYIFNQIFTEENIELGIKKNIKIAGRLIEHMDGTAHYENFDASSWGNGIYYFNEVEDKINRCKFLINKH